MKKIFLGFIVVIMMVNVFMIGSDSDSIPLLEIGHVAFASGESGGCDNCREVLTGQKVFATEITGEAELSGEVSLGQLWDAGIAAQFGADITWTTEDAYLVNCYDGGSACCTTMDWTMCATNGCPTAGIKCIN